MTTAAPAPAGRAPTTTWTSTPGSGLTATSLLGGSLSQETIDSFPIPIDLLPIYQAAAVQYGVPWEVLAAINRVETDFGSDLSISSAGAEGWMQFMPATWRQYGLSANGVRGADPYDPVDAIFSAARYLHAAGAATDLRGAVFAYNHSAAYVDSVMSIAAQLAVEPRPIIAALSALTAGVFPIDALSRYSDAAAVEQPGPYVDITARAGAPAVAAQNGRIVAIGRSAALGRYVSLRDADGTTYTYAGLGSLAATYPVARAQASPAAAARHWTALVAAHAPAATGVRRASSAIAGAATAAGAYVDPLAGAHVVPERIDMGVDFSGSGPLAALGDGVVTESYAPGSGSGWPGGGFVEYRLSDGPDAGAYIYAAEGVVPTVRVGQPVAAGQTVALLNPSSPTGIEMGLGAGTGTSAWAAVHGGYAEGDLTGAGAWFSALLAALGGPAGLTEGRAMSGPVPSGFGADGLTIDGSTASALGLAVRGSDVVSYIPARGAPLQLPAGQATSRPLRTGAWVLAGTVLGHLGRVGRASDLRPTGRLRFAIRPAATGGPAINPAPVLDAWRSLAAAPVNAVRRPTIGQAMLMSEPALEHAVVTDARIRLSSCGRVAIATGQVDRQVLAALELLGDSGARPSVSAPGCGARPSADAATLTVPSRLPDVNARALGVEIAADPHGAGQFVLTHATRFGANPGLAAAARNVLSAYPAHGSTTGPAGWTPVSGVLPVDPFRARHPLARRHDATSGAPTYQTVLGVPADNVAVIGASPGEAAGEAWAQGYIGAQPATVGAQQVASGQEVLMLWTDASAGWQVIPVDGADGQPVAVTPVGSTRQGWSAAAVTPGGGVALAGAVGGPETVVTRDPGPTTFAAATPPPSSVLLTGESLYPTDAIPVMTAIDDTAGTGVFVAPDQESATAPGVLHYAAGAWTREPICATDTAATCTAPSAQLTAVALSASSLANAWLAATSSTGSIELFQRTTVAGGPAWVQVGPPTWLLGTPGQTAPPGETVAFPVQSPSGSAAGNAPVLTAVAGGVWVDVKVRTASVPLSTEANATTFVSTAGAVAGTWCYPVALCPQATGSLGGDLPSGYGSFAWPGGTVGTRVITGLPDAVELRLATGATDFRYTPTSGDVAGTDGGGVAFGPGGETLGLVPGHIATGGAALGDPGDGWLGAAIDSATDATGPDLVHVTSAPTADAVASWPVPFDRPLLAIAGQPGTSPDSPAAQALAVGANGQVARYVPGTGWVAEFLYNSAGQVQTPTLRGVAWPQPDLAFAVGDGGALWRYDAQTALWTPDPAAPIGFQDSLDAIAFSPLDPNVGYAVGRQGTILAYGKTWTPQAPPAGLAQATFSSIAFAGGEALVAYRQYDTASADDVGGVLDNTGSGWVVDPQVASLLAQLPTGKQLITRVAGLPDGGAVAAGPGVVLERDSGTSAWRFAPIPLGDSAGGSISALAAYQDGPTVRAVVSVDVDPNSSPNQRPMSALWQETDNPIQPSFGQPPLLWGPDPLPSTGALLRETATGWVDEEGTIPANQVDGGGSSGLDLPYRPDPILALWTDAAAQQAWAVGGQTGGDTLPTDGQPGSVAAAMTAGVMRVGGGITPPAAAAAPVTLPTGQAAFAFGGDSGCLNPCADDSAQQLGPPTWLRAAIASASQITGLRAFLATGQPASGVDSLSADAYGRELAAYDGVLSTGGALPVYAAITSGDVTPAAGPAAFAQALGGHVPVGASAGPASPAGTAAYAVDSTGAQGGRVRVIVLDYSSGSISTPPAAGGESQLAWLEAQLADARQAGIPAIVVGGDSLTGSAQPNYATDAGAVAAALLAGGASAYLFYDASGQNVSQTIGAGTNTIPAYGSGTLGYVRPPLNLADQETFLGASGYVVLTVNTAQRNATTGRAPVTANLVPNAGQLALDAVNGTLLRRSSVSLFEGLARRPLAGTGWTSAEGHDATELPDAYTVLPETCLGAVCSQFIAPSYTFTSSNPTIGTFVEHDPASSNPLAVLQDSSGRPIPDAASGLFCAFNPGTTTVTISSGGLSYSEAVTVQAGSVLQPCGTVPATVLPRQPTSGSPSSPPAPAPSTGTSPGGTTPIPPPPPPAPVKVPNPPARIPTVARPTPHAPPLVVPLVPQTVPLPRALFPVATVTPRPTPPTGFSSVPAAAPVPGRVIEEEREEKEATESANAFADYHPDRPSPVIPHTVLVLVLLAAGAGGAGLRRRARPRGGAAFARTEVRPDHDLWRRRR